MSHFDSTFGACPVALAIANLISTQNDVMDDIKWFPFFNGRERHISIQVRRYSYPSMENLYPETAIWSFGENRNSDDIVVDFYCVKNRFFQNAFNRSDLTQEELDFTYANQRRFFGYDKIQEVVNILSTEIREWRIDGTVPNFKKMDD